MNQHPLTIINYTHDIFLDFHRVKNIFTTYFHKLGYVETVALADEDMQDQCLRFKPDHHTADVLSFPASGQADNPHIILLCPSEIRRSMIDFCSSYNVHMHYLWIHGLLHLQGMTHEDDTSAMIMNSGICMILHAISPLGNYAS